MCGYALLCRREVSCYDFIESWVVCLELFACVDRIVYSVDWMSFLVDVEPALDSFGPILIDVAAGVCVDPFSCSECRVQSCLKLIVNLRIYRNDSELVDRMCELMYKDVLFPVTVSLKAEYILLCA